MNTDTQGSAPSWDDRREAGQQPTQSKGKEPRDGPSSHTATSNRYSRNRQKGSKVPENCARVRSTITEGPPSQSQGIFLRHNNAGIKIYAHRSGNNLGEGSTLNKKAEYKQYIQYNLND